VYELLFNKCCNVIAGIVAPEHRDEGLSKDCDRGVDTKSRAVSPVNNLFAPGIFDTIVKYAGVQKD